MKHKTHNLRTLLALLLAAMMMVGSLAGCTSGGNTADETTTTAATTAAETTTAAESTAAEETSDETTTEETTTSETSAPETTDVETTEEPTGPATTEADETRPETESETETEAPAEDIHLIREGEAGCVIGYLNLEENAEARVAAYTLRDTVVRTTGVTLPVCEDECPDGPYVIYLHQGEVPEAGDCGYTISVDGPTQTIRITAASLAGFDNAMARLMADATTGEGTMALPGDYDVTGTVDSGAGYDLDGAEDFKEDYVNAPFYNDKNDAVAYVSNAMWHMFGAIDDGQSLVYRFGNEPTYFEWVSEKIMWSGDAEYINSLKGKIRGFAQTETGYMWSWSSHPYWQVDDTYCIHYDGTFRYIAAVYDVISWERSTAFLSEVDSSASKGEYAELDASQGRTVLEKTEAAWNYILKKLHGEEGIIRLTEDSVFLNEDGSLRFDYVKEAGKNCWNNTGLPKSAASNYWDNLCFGNLDAYENALFYEATQAMIGIYGMLGGEYLEKIPTLLALAEKLKENYDTYFWSEATGRYVGCIDVENNVVDYGFTFLNFEALKYGLGDAEKAISVFDWVDGRRIVEGDTRTGSEIMSYVTMMRKTGIGRKLAKFDPDVVLAPCVNTVAINNRDNQKTGQVWWHGPAGIDPFAGAAYGNHCENGGYIFYTVFYELMARTKYLGAQSTTDRLRQIARVYEFHRLKSDEAASGAAWLEGLIGEFPESGLVPTVYFYGLMGVSAEADGLHVAPQFNDVYETMGVTSTTYGGKVYGIEEHRDGSLIITCHDGEVHMELSYTPGRFAAYTVTLYAADGTAISEEGIRVDENGTLHVALDATDVARVEITPVIE